MSFQDTSGDHSRQLMRITLKTILLDTSSVFLLRTLLDLALGGYGQMDLAYFLSTAVFAVLFGLLFRRLIIFQLKNVDKLLEPILLKSIVIEFYAWEKCFLEAGASYFKGIEGVGGKLVLTNERLIFKSHKMNIQNHEQMIFLRELGELSAAPMPEVKAYNVLVVRLTNGETYRFAVKQADRWIENITLQKRAG
jgi:hypothetical protein